MSPARTSKRRYGKTKLLVLSAFKPIVHATVDKLPEFLAPGDLLVVNRAGTLPASFFARYLPTGARVEVRLAAFQGSFSEWPAFIFGMGGTGDWRTPTEDRGETPEVKIGDQFEISPNFRVEVTKVFAKSFVQIKILSADPLRELYRHGKPIQYSYLREELQVWDQQSLFSSLPLSTEAPSATFPLTWEQVLEFRNRGVEIVDILHGAGISSSGSPELDGLLPLTEYYEISEQSAKKISQAKKEGRRVIAVGTTVVRALESAYKEGKILAGKAMTNLKISPDKPIRAVEGILTGMHDPGASHMDIVEAFIPKVLVEKGYREAQALGYLGHEFGDATLILTQKTQILSA